MRTEILHDFTATAASAFKNARVCSSQIEIARALVEYVAANEEVEQLVACYQAIACADLPGNTRLQVAQATQRYVRAQVQLNKLLDLQAGAA